MNVYPRLAALESVKKLISYGHLESVVETNDENLTLTVEDLNFPSQV